MELHRSKYIKKKSFRPSLIWNNRGCAFQLSYLQKFLYRNTVLPSKVGGGGVDFQSVCIQDQPRLLLAGKNGGTPTLI